MRQTCAIIRFDLAAEVRLCYGVKASRHAEGGLLQPWLMLGWRYRKNLDERGAQAGKPAHLTRCGTLFPSQSHHNLKPSALLTLPAREVHRKG